jgi:Ecdysteroid kinase-like family
MKTTMPELFDSARSKVSEIVYCSEAAEFYTHSLESSLREALSSLETSNSDGQLDDVIALIDSKLSGKLYEIMACHVKENSKWNVLAHGDLWVNNLMFRANDCLQVKLIDLQTVRYTSLCIDIIHFLYSSTIRPIRMTYYDSLIEDYHCALMAALEIYLPNSRKQLQQEFSIENLKLEIKRHVIYGLGICMWLLPAVTFNPDFLPDLDAMTLETFTTCAQERNIIKMHTSEYHQRMKDVALEFYQNNYLS